MDQNIPQIIKDVGFDFHWDSKKVWVLDGLHRLVKLAMQGDQRVKVRIIPREKISEIIV